MGLGETIGLAVALLTLPGLLAQPRQGIRLLSLAANAVFIGYGLAFDLFPVVAAHIVLLPCNLYCLHRLRERAALLGRRRRVPRNVFLGLEAETARP